MAIIQKKLSLEGSKGKEEVIALFDTGSTYSCIKPELALKLGIIEKLPRGIELRTAKEGEVLVATQRISLDFYLDGYRFSDEFILLSNLSEPVIIGAKTMQAWRFKLDLENDEVIIDPRVTKLRLLTFK
uniref:Retroviral-like aspartic protease n=1 Tax=candidate division WOR-3 bacterium TaxID=2052148 RepID=A0A7C6AA79_UNCW3